MIYSMEIILLLFAHRVKLIFLVILLLFVVVVRFVLKSCEIMKYLFYYSNYDLSGYSEFILKAILILFSKNVPEND